MAMKLSRFGISAAMLLAAVSVAAVPAAPRKPVIQVAILLDTSNSMDGLIDQARTQLWSVVNELATARKNGQTPELQVGLYEYGNDSLPAAKGYVRKVLPLTTDLDKVSEELFALKTNGGQEYCGRVINDAVNGLAWSPSNNELKIIFIAGNEAFTQGAVDFRASCKTAITRGIVVNTIFCGDQQTGIDTSWKEGADLADGRFTTIDQNYRVAEIVAPQDKEIAALGQQLNSTYIAYGDTGRASASRQSGQDAKLASAAPSANIERQVAKSKSVYTNSSWDLVDAKNEGKVDLDKIATKDLPAEMQKMTPAQRNAHVEANAKKRSEIQKKILKLDGERKQYVAKARTAKPAATTLDAAVVAATRTAGAKKGYSFPGTK
jgi:hypothetical protein